MTQKTKSWCALFNCCKKNPTASFEPSHLAKRHHCFAEKTKLFLREPHVDDHHHYLSLSSVLVSTSQHCSKKQQKQVMTSQTWWFPTTFNGTLVYFLVWNPLGHVFFFCLPAFQSNYSNAWCWCLLSRHFKPVNLLLDKRFSALRFQAVDDCESKNHVQTKWNVCCKMGRCP